jgi:hypothetical protein
LGRTKIDLNVDEMLDKREIIPLVFDDLSRSLALSTDDGGFESVYGCGRRAAKAVFVHTFPTSSNFDLLLT